MDAVFFLKHSEANDLEIRYALRGIARHAPWIHKVWILGDRPAFLTHDVRVAEHMPDDLMAWVGPYQTPVRNFFLMFYLMALTPEIENEILFFSDDFILLRDLSPENARIVRYLQDLNLVKSRGRGLWKESLWRTYDLLRRFGYETLNYETHVPTYFQKRWILDAVRDFRDFITEDRFYGMLALTAIFNHARRQHKFPVTHLEEENSRAGFYGKAPTTAEIHDAVIDRSFLGFDEGGFGEDLRMFLANRFPEPCMYEREGEGIGLETFRVATGE